MNPLVSIILTSYNKSASVGQAIESVIKQTYPHWELFIMDDNSNEETVGVIEQFLDHPRIYYYNSHVAESDRYKTTRYATLINQAIADSRGKYLSYLTDDNIYLPQRLKVMVNYLEKNKTVQIVYSEQLVKVYGHNQTVTQEFVRKNYGILHKAANRVDHCSVMHTRKIANQVFNKYQSYWDDDPQFWLNGDAAFWTRLNQLQPFYPIPQVLDVAWKFPESFQRLYLHVPNTIPDGTLIRGLAKDVYLIDQQKRRKISEEMMTRLHYSKNSIIKIPDPFLFKYDEGAPVDENVLLSPALFPNQRLVKSKNAPAIYYLQNNRRYLIKNMNTFNYFQFNPNEIVMVDDKTIEAIPNSQQIIEPLNTIQNILPNGVLWKSNQQFFLSYNNRLHPIQHEVLKRLKLSDSKAVTLPPTFLPKFPRGKSFSYVKNNLM
ncbi:glycosyltransferase family 2 protein [Bacillus rubiinfantis]|uniref:glycosyltransferase family 2 protein n=1 Tax=Bacillus rubiinfantis TaxID=1499680 RepID=UPI0005A971F8|nr:glycosyltransferase family 2 protein [Bacillus rubiinfantis]